MISQNKVLGYLCVVAGLSIVMFALGEFIIRAAVAVGALMLINYGMRLIGVPPMQYMVVRSWFNRFG